MSGAPIPDCDGSDGFACVKCEILCDNGTAPSTSFLRTYVLDCATGDVTSTFDTLLDGTTPYVPIGTVGVCTGDINIPPTNAVDAELVCFDAGPSPLIRVTVYNPTTGAIVAGPFFRDPITGLPVVPGGAAIPCAEAAADVEQEILCDDGFDPPSPFLRVYEWTDGVNTGVTDFELDGTTPYVLVGDAVACPVQITTTENGESIRSGFTRISGVGASWAVGVDTVGRVQAVTFLVNNRTGVTITDDFGNVIAPFSNFDTFEWSTEALDSEIEPTLSVAIAAAAGDVTIIWTEVA
jgi:hypothetical protein